MVYLATSQEWLEQSSLLLAARPSTTKILTKYRVQKPTSPSRPSRRKPANTTTAPTTTTTQDATPGEADGTPAQPSAFLTLKTWDPESGVCLKYRTNKAAEVGRLFGNLGRLGRGMARLPDGGDGDAAMLDVPGGGDEEARAQSPAPGVAGKDAKGGASGAGGGGGGKKKKKGKK